MAGQRIYLQTERLDPRSLFRGDYVRLTYPIAAEVPDQIKNNARELDSLIYVTVTKDRPAKFVRANLKKPKLKDGEACIAARPNGGGWWRGRARVSFPQIAVYFVPEGEGRELERNLDKMVAEVAVTKGCNAVVLGLEHL